MIDLFIREGADTTFYDPFIPEYRHKSKVHTGAKELTDKMLKEADIVVVCTAHSTFDYDRIQKLSQEVFDTRNAMKDVKDRSNIELL